MRVGPADILQLGHPDLRRPSSRVGEGRDATFEEESRRLIETLAAFRQRFGFGRAVAAPQIGVRKRVIAADLGQGPFLLVDPEITWRSELTFSMWDDCMSFPGLLVRLRRHGSVSLRFFDAEGQPQTMNRLDLPSAELFQHEIDHLEGILAVDRADEIRDLVSREAFEQFRLAFEGRVDYTGRG